MSDTPGQVNCDVDFGAVSRVGVFANAFRVVRDIGDEFFLDFLAYSASEKKAELVARLRVTKSLLAPMRLRLDGVLQELTGSVSETPPSVILVPHKDDDKLN